MSGRYVFFSSNNGREYYIDGYELGKGSDILSIESTHQQSTAIATGAGRDMIIVENISGQTNALLYVTEISVGVANLGIALC